MLIALIEVFAAIFVWLELIVRNAAIYMAVLFFPVALAAAIWPALSAWPGRLGAAADAVRDPQAGRADRALARRQRGRRGPVLRQRRLRLGRDDPRRDRDLRARRVRAVGADVPARGGRRERLHGRRYARSRRSRRHATAMAARCAAEAACATSAARTVGAQRAADPRRRLARWRSAAQTAAPAAGAPPCWRARGRRRRRRGRRRQRGRATAPWRWAERQSALAASPWPPARPRRPRRRADRTPRAPPRPLVARRAVPDSVARRRRDSGRDCGARRWQRFAAGCRAERPPRRPSPDAGGSAEPEHPAQPGGRSSRVWTLWRKRAATVAGGRSAVATLVAAPGSSPLAGVERHGLAPTASWAIRGQGGVDAGDDLPVRAAPAGGFLLGLRIPQLLGFVVAGALALALLRVGGLGALALALACLVLAACVLLVPVHGHTLEQWAPLTVRFLLGRYGSRSRFHAQRAQLGHLVALPSGRARAAAARGAVGSPRRAGGPRVPRGPARAVRERPLRRRQGPWRADVHRGAAHPRPRVRAARPG